MAEGLAYLDTHAVVWMKEGRTDWLSVAGRREVERSRLLVSPMVLLELTYLFELGRLKKGADELIGELGDAVGLSVCPMPFPLVVRQARAETWTRDPFDRMIAAQARCAGAWLVTADEKIQKNYDRAMC